MLKAKKLVIYLNGKKTGDCMAEPRAMGKRDSVKRMAENGEWDKLAGFCRKNPCIAAFGARLVMHSREKVRKSDCAGRAFVLAAEFSNGKFGTDAVDELAAMGRADLVAEVAEATRSLDTALHAMGVLGVKSGKDALSFLACRGAASAQGLMADVQGGPGGSP